MHPRSLSSQNRSYFGTYRRPKWRFQPRAGYSDQNNLPYPRVSEGTSTQHTVLMGVNRPSKCLAADFNIKLLKIMAFFLYFLTQFPALAPQNLNSGSDVTAEDACFYLHITATGSLISATPPRTGSLLFSNLFLPLLEFQKPTDLWKKRKFGT